MPDHDGLYHRLFSHAGMVAQLLREFAAGPWLEALDLSAMQRVNAHFHADSGQRRDGDVIWRIPLRQGGEAYLLLLLEFQSRPERWMALRVMVYVGLLWQSLIREKRLLPDGRLPPVLPIVLYNGDPRWGMPVSLADLIGLPEVSPFWPWQPDMRYHLIDEGAYGAAELARRDSLAALLFRLEHCQSPDQVVPVVDELLEWFRRHPEAETLMRPFALLAGRLTEIAGDPRTERRISENLWEVRSMLATRAEEWKRQWLQQGLEQGLRRGEASLLKRQLERRFGPLPVWVGERLTAADAGRLEEWSLRVLDAGTLDEIFH